MKKERDLNLMFAIFYTNMGDFKVFLNKEKAPITVDNFIKYAKSKHYDNTIFHRVIDNFMIQGGGMDVEMKEKSTNLPIRNEANNGLKNVRGSIAMARTGDPHSATTQFFINVVDNDFLDFREENQQGWGYAVFGEVVDGMGIIDKIKVTPTGTRLFHQDVPTENIIINSVEVVE